MSTLTNASIHQATIEFALVDGQIVGTIGVEDADPVAFAGIEELERVISRATGSRAPLMLVPPPADDATGDGSQDADDPSLCKLTRRELEVVATAARGASNREIAEEMYYSVKSVEAYLTRIYRKLGLSGRSDLVQLWRTRAASEIEDLDVPEHVARQLTGGTGAVGAVVQRPVTPARVTLMLLTVDALAAEHGDGARSPLRAWRSALRRTPAP